jgi:type VI protein secretion system component VasK
MSTNGNGKMIGRVALGLVAAMLLAWAGWVSAACRDFETHKASSAAIGIQLAEIKESLAEMQREVTEVRLILARQRLDSSRIYHE